MLYVLKQLTAFALTALLVRLAGEAALRRGRFFDADSLGATRSLAVSWPVPRRAYHNKLLLLLANNNDNKMPTDNNAKPNAISSNQAGQQPRDSLSDIISPNVTHKEQDDTLSTLERRAMGDQIDGQ